VHSNRKLWFSRNLALIWLADLPWHNPCLIQLAPEASGDPTNLDIEPFVEPSIRRHVQSGYDWYWRAEPTSVARLVRTNAIARQSALALFPWFDSALSLLLEWLDLACPNGIREANKLALQPVTLPNSRFLQDALGLVESGVLPRWIGWEADLAKRDASPALPVVTIPNPQPEPRQRKAKPDKAPGTSLFA